MRACYETRLSFAGAKYFQWAVLLVLFISFLGYSFHVHEFSKVVCVKVSAWYCLLVSVSSHNWFTYVCQATFCMCNIVMLKCQHDIVCLLVFRGLFNLCMYIRPHAVCVTASPALLSLIISLFPTFCMYYLPSAYNILFALYPCAGYMRFMRLCCLLYPARNPHRGAQSPKQPAEINRVPTPPPTICAT